MIVEMFSDLVKGRLRNSRILEKGDQYLDLEDLKPIFDKMEIPVPEGVGEDCLKTREGGYMVMLNDCGAVLRIYATRQQYNDDKTINDMAGNIYHSNALPVIGLVHFDQINVQLMPGKPHSMGFGSDFRRVIKPIIEDTGYSDYPVEANFADVGDKIQLLDTVEDVNPNVYEGFSKKSWVSKIFCLKSQLEKLLEANKPYETLQQSFYDAWSGDKPFSEFWDDMRKAKADGLLVDGWNNSHLDMDMEGKGGNIVEMSRKYEARLHEYNQEEQPVLEQ
tara:strand:- start:4686 stop:5516 length:831 start_codon:yes stop_codon:yes gene_type:complete